MFEPGQRRHPSDQEIAALIDFGANWLVLGGNAAHGVRDHRICQGQPIIGPRVETVRRPAEFRQCLVKQPASKVACEGPTSSVGTGHAWREADDQQGCVLIAKAGDGAVEPIRVLSRDIVAIGRETRAQPAVSRRFSGNHADLALGGDFDFVREEFFLTFPRWTRWAANDIFQLFQLNEVVGLAAKFVSNHRRL